MSLEKSASLVFTYIYRLSRREDGRNRTVFGIGVGAFRSRRRGRDGDYLRVRRQRGVEFGAFVFVFVPRIFSFSMVFVCRNRMRIRVLPAMCDDMF